MDNRVIRLSGPEDEAAIDKLQSEAFGPGRFARTAYRVRETAAVPGFGLVAWRDGELVGAVQFTPVSINGRTGAMMLGPLAVAPCFKAQGFGRALVEEGAARARELGARIVILVGDLPYYARMGFRRVPPGQILMPGPVDGARILARELQDGALAQFNGLVSGLAQD